MTSDGRNLSRRRVVCSAVTVAHVSDKVRHYVIESAERGDVEGRPTVAVGQPNVGPVSNEQLHNLQVPVHTALVQRRLPVAVDEVDVQVDAAQEQLEFVGVASANGR